MRTLRDIFLGLGALLLGPIHPDGYGPFDPGAPRTGPAPRKRAALGRTTGFAIGACAGSAAGLAAVVLAGWAPGGDPMGAALVLGAAGGGTLAGGLLGSLPRDGG